jgi:hypothetical protein
MNFPVATPRLLPQLPGIFVAHKPARFPLARGLHRHLIAFGSLPASGGPFPYTSDMFSGGFLNTATVDDYGLD